MHLSMLALHSHVLPLVVCLSLGYSNFTVDGYVLMKIREPYVKKGKSVVEVLLDHDPPGFSKFSKYVLQYGIFFGTGGHTLNLCRCVEELNQLITVRKAIQNYWNCNFGSSYSLLFYIFYFHTLLHSKF